MVISDSKFAMSQPREDFFMTQAWLKMLTQTPLDRTRWASFAGRWIGREPTPIGPQGPPPREHSGPQSTINLAHRRTYCCTWQKGRALSHNKMPLQRNLQHIYFLGSPALDSRPPVQHCPIHPQSRHVSSRTQRVSNSFSAIAHVVTSLTTWNNNVHLWAQRMH